MRELSKEERTQMYKNLIFVSIISADNDKYTEDTKQEIIRRYHEADVKDWSYILDPLGEDKYKYMKILCE
jgi:uncharacterized protein (UPF0371 family)